MLIVTGRTAAPMNAQPLIYIRGAPPNLFTLVTGCVCVVLKWDISSLALEVLFHVGIQNFYLQENNYSTFSFRICFLDKGYVTLELVNLKAFN